MIDISRDRNVEGKAKKKADRQDRQCENQTDRKNQRTVERDKRRRKCRRYRRRRRIWLKRAVMLIGSITFCLLLYYIIRGLAGFGIFADVFHEEMRRMLYESAVEKPMIEEDFLTVNPNSRPGYALNRVDNIFVHYTANPGTSAAQNRSYFENLAITNETSASAHFIIGYEGEIIQCLPLEEIGYAVKGRNQDSISIECCYLQEDGEFTKETYESLIWLLSWLLKEYDLTPEEILRHYDEGGKKCPLYYVENEEAWQQLLEDVRQYILDSKK